jgi:CTP synthase
MHVTLIPYIKAAGELKTKPSQQSIAKLREIGLSPQVLVCRTEHPLDDDIRAKLSVFCNVPLAAVIEARDVDHTIYELPLMLQAERLDDTVCGLLGLKVPPPDMTEWKQFVDRLIHPKRRVKIAVVGKYIELQDAYKSIYESLTHAAAGADCAAELVLVEAASWFRAGLATAGRRGKSARRSTRGSMACRFSGCVWGCRSRRSNSRGTCADWRTRTQRSSIPRRSIR